MLLMDKYVPPLGGEYPELDEPVLSANRTDHALKHARSNTPITIMPGANGMKLAHIHRQAAFP